MPVEKGRAGPILKESSWKSINPPPGHEYDRRREEARAGERFFSHVKVTEEGRGGREK